MYVTEKQLVMAKTVIKPSKKVSPRSGLPAPNGPKYSKENQPSPEAKKAGWAKKRAGKLLSQFILEQGYKGLKDSALRKGMAEYFNVPEDKITVEMMMTFRQIEKAITKADTEAFKAIMDRAHGKPVQENIVRTDDLTKLPITFK